MELADGIFKRKAYDENSLTEYGFAKSDDGFTYSELISDGRFMFVVNIVGSKIETDVIELAWNEPFTLYHIDYVGKRYGDKIEYLWEKFPDNAVFRRKDNQKWYGALLTVGRKKLGLDGDGTVEVVDLRETPEAVAALVDGKSYFAGYHMNKKHWYTVCLDGSVSDEEIKQRIDNSYIIASKR